MNRRDRKAQCEHGLSSFLHSVSPGKWMAVVFMVHAMKLATGCSTGPADGAAGGKCKDDGCHTHCDDGPCDNATGICDGTSGYTPSGGGFYDAGSRAPFCAVEPWTNCNADAGEIEMYCAGLEPPGTCHMTGGNDMLFCCEPESDGGDADADAELTDAGEGGADGSELDAADE